MSDEPLAWKIAFGVAVMLICGVTYLVRGDREPTPAAVDTSAAAPPSAPSAPAPMSAPAPQRDAAVPPLEIAPPDIPEAQAETTERVRIGLREPAALQRHRAAARRVPSAKVHLVRAGHPTVRRARRPSPYLVGHKHYPYDPRDRDRWRDGNA